MSSAFEKSSIPDEYSYHAPKRGRESARSGRASLSARLEIPNTDALPGSDASASFPDGRAQSRRFHAPRFAERTSSSKPLAERSLRAAVLQLWRPAIAIAAVAALAVFAFTRPLPGAKSQSRASFDEAPSARSPAMGKKIQEAQRGAPAAPKLVFDPMTRQHPGENLPLGVSVQDSRDGGLIVVSGLASGANLSAGNPVDDNSWWLSFADLQNLAILPPLKFTGAMDIAVELRLADATLSDRKTRRIEWADEGDAGAKPSSAPTVQADAQGGLIAALKQGQELIAQGDIEAARQLVRRWVEADVSAGGPAALDGRPKTLEDSGDAGAKLNTEANSRVRNDGEAKDEPKSEKSIQDEYNAGCFVKIDGRVRFDGRCQIRVTKDASVTFALDRNPVTLAHNHGRAWMATWGKREVGKVFKRGSCWGSRRVFICERGK